MTEKQAEHTPYVVIKVFQLRTDRIIAEQEVPLFDLEAIAGLANIFIDGQVPLDKIMVPDMPECDGAMHVRGDSMEPVLRNGDIVLFKTTQSRRGGLYFGNPYVIDFHLDGDDYIVVKFLHEAETPGYYRLESANPNYPPKEIPVANVRGLALVKAHISYNVIK